LPPPTPQALGKEGKAAVRAGIRRHARTPGFDEERYVAGWRTLDEHPWEHQIFVLSGEGTLVGSEGPVPFKPGDVIFIAPGEPHQIVNDGDALVEFVCLIPKAALTAYYIGRAAERNAASPSG
jgi:mannose-6-phosphate isomerase-like protein (cupin superfamily)